MGGVRAYISVRNVEKDEKERNEGAEKRGKKIY